MPADNNTRVVSARLDETLVERLERVAKADQRSMGNIMRLMILRVLPEFEREVLGSAAPTPTPAEKAEVAA